MSSDGFSGGLRRWSFIFIRDFGNGRSGVLDGHGRVGLDSVAGSPGRIVILGRDWVGTLEPAFRNVECRLDSQGSTLSSGKVDQITGLGVDIGDANSRSGPTFGEYSESNGRGDIGIGTRESDPALKVLVEPLFEESDGRLDTFGSIFGMNDRHTILYDPEIDSTGGNLLRFPLVVEQTGVTRVVVLDDIVILVGGVEKVKVGIVSVDDEAESIAEGHGDSGTIFDVGPDSTGLGLPKRGGEISVGQ
jgi:hypothetical protein